MSVTDGLAQVNAFATYTALSAWAAAGNFLAILILIGFLYLFSRYAGRGPFVALLLSFYAAYALFVAFPYKALLPSAPAITAIITHVALYAGLVIAFYIILRRVVVSDFLYIGLFGLLALCFFGAAFLLALGYHVFGVAGIYQFPIIVTSLFAPDQFFFWWFIAPAVGLFFLAR